MSQLVSSLWPYAKPLSAIGGASGTEIFKYFVVLGFLVQIVFIMSVIVGFIKVMVNAAPNEHSVAFEAFVDIFISLVLICAQVLLLVLPVEDYYSKFQPFNSVKFVIMLVEILLCTIVTI